MEVVVKLNLLLMKKASILLIGIILVVLQGCEKIYKEDDLNVYTISSTDELNNLIASLYYSLTYTYFVSREGLFGNADDVVIHPNGKDNLSLIERIYTNYYKTIACANDLLKKSNDLGKSRQVANLLGEIYLIRAYCYYTLARCFGNPPLVFDIDISYVVERPDYKAVYDSIEADLKRAIALLPVSFNESRVKYITPHRGTAKALLAEVYLTRGGYPLKDAAAYRKAWQTAGEVIDSASLYNFDLLPDFVNLWNGRHDMNPESVFSLFCLTRTNYWVSRDTIYHTKSDSLSYNPKYKNVLIVGLGVPFGGGLTGVKFFNTFPQGYRKENTYQTRQLKQRLTNIVDTFYWEGDTFTHFRYINDTFIYYKIKAVNDMPMKKYYSAVDSMEMMGGSRTPMNISSFSGNYYTGNVYYILRYAHTLLTYAEAKARDGQLDAAAFEAVNKIRRRANHVDLNSPSKYDLDPGLESNAFIDSVVWERAYEFCGEPGNRWFDIVRTEQVGQIPNLLPPLRAFPIPFNRSTNFFDLPPIDKNLNPGLYN
jgi:starch-binding outer membrane protein, SusD/RagB family